MRFLKNPRFLSLAVGSAVAMSLVGNIPVAQAATLSTVQIQAILNLLQAFNADATTIANVQAALENTATSTQSVLPPTGSSSEGQASSSPSGSPCFVFTNTFSIGSTDRSTEGEVSRLQAFLGKYKSIYPEDAVTGFFGSSTLAAVQKWQAEHGIVSSGSPDSTGFGTVGPLTREDMNKEMERECENGDMSSSSSDSTASSSDSSTSSTTSQDSSSGDN